MGLEETNQDPINEENSAEQAEDLFAETGQVTMLRRPDGIFILLVPRGKSDDDALEEVKRSGFGLGEASTVNDVQFVHDNAEYITALEEMVDLDGEDDG